MENNIFPASFDAKLFSTDLLQFRAAKGLSRAAAAKLIGTTATTINHIECHSIIPKLEFFYNACRIMGKDSKEYFK